MNETTLGIIIIAVGVLAAVNLALLAGLLRRRDRGADAVDSMTALISANQKQSAELLDTRLTDMNRSLGEKQELSRRATEAQLTLMQAQLKTAGEQQEQKLESIRTAVEKRLSYIQEDNNKKLDEIRVIVDQKLEEKMNRSFKLVSEQLEQVHKGLGEMQTLAAGVGDLKKVLSNVKTRGILGEIQLGAIFEEILSPEQYLKDVPTRAGASERVEFAVKFPSEDGGVLLPVDSKFPLDVYSRLLEAYESGSRDEVTTAVGILKTRLKASAKDIRDKYVSPPDTTDFGVLFLPVEGLYAEAVKAGMIETLQKEYKVSLAGPSTMAALLNSLQMGFRTLAIQKRSGEVWRILGAVKTEFEKFGDTLAATQKRISQANDELDKLVGVRTRVIQRTLKGVTRLESEQASAYLPSADEGFENDISNTEGENL